jgi:excisionase family DNA binding protein
MKLFETLTPNEVAKSLQLHPFTVTRLAREGKIPAFKVGGVWRFRKDQFEDWITRSSGWNKRKKRSKPRAR